MTGMPDDELVEQFADSMLSTYMDEDATFPLSIWAAAPTLENAHFPRTTNAL